ncbi:MAG TPA: hypothetical protein VGX25_35385 [Actinophytocola sp.]|uniref:hypothetical protein n=1 Tax=Actinophytocola sp. TaxID=1872138 RepID=UPI002DDD8184|nr:hypothetical protein [Actinophytocola sp.]HEV2784698.1 hypothetical protein [Actinophytocola sp.]
METTPELEFEFFLAQKLGMTRAEMLRRVGQDEFIGWKVFYNRKAQREQLAAMRR